ncbi:MAG: sigma-70 family RNA polymerase sigma factor [Chloroflexota bacterium]
MKSENHLLRGARRLDLETLAEIYDQYSPGLYRYAMRLLGDAPLAEDCVSETFSRFLRALHAGGGPKEYLQAYLYRVAHNWISDHYRRNKVPLTLLDEAAAVDDGTDTLQAVEISLEQDRVRTALRLLTPDQRQVIVLKFLEGWTNNEVAEAMKKTEGSVKSLQHRALASLKRILLSESK